MAQANLRSINQLVNSDHKINDMIAFINGGRVNFPPRVVHANYLQKSQLFYVANRRDLMFVNPNLQVIRKADITQTLQRLYDDKQTGLNKAIQTFYYLITQRYLNITRQETQDFLKTQQIYNISRPKKTAKPYALQTYRQPNQAYAMDFIHITNIYRQPGQAQLYILTVVDCFSKFVWLFATNNNRDNTVIHCLQTLINNNNIPRVIIADNGFKIAIKNFLQQHNIELLNNPSHVPVKYAEACNRTVRRYLRELILRNDRIPNMRWNWANEINTIERAINNTKSSTTGKTPNELFHDPNQQVQNPNFQAVVQKVNTQKENRIRPHLNDTMFQLNQPVHVDLTTAYRDMRKMAKDDDLKNIPVRWSPEVYFIDRVFHARNRHGLPLYSIRNAQGQTLRTDFYHHNQAQGILKLKATDLLDASLENRQVFNNQDALRINRIPRPQANPLAFM